MDRDATKPVFRHGPTKLDSNQFTQLLRLARKNCERQWHINLSDIFGYLRELKPAMRAIYSEIVTLVIILLVIPAANAIFSFTQSENLFKTRMNNLIS